MARTTEDRIATAQASYEAGFLSKAAQKRALEQLSYAYAAIRSGVMDAILTDRGTFADLDSPTPEQERLSALYWAVPAGLHHVRERHFEALAAYPAFAIVRDLIALRDAISIAEIAPAPAKPEIEIKAEKIRRSIVEEMERRKAVFVEGLDVSRLWNELFPREDGKIALPVSVNAHLVHGHKGTVFVRHFFYLRGKLTPLNTIIAIAERLATEAA